MADNVKLISKVLDRNDSDYNKRINQVFKLRYKEMILEYNPNAPKEGIDCDDYDKYCDHLVVIDEVTDEVVGTYRLIKKEHVQNLEGKFLLEEEFNIDALKNRKVLEVGRACVAEAYRSGGVIMLLWKGSLQYALRNNMDFMVGTASFHGIDAEPYRKQLAYLTKNYLSKEELESLELIVSAFLDLAENRAKRHIPMTMEDWSNRLDEFLKLTDREILQDAGKISHKIACDKAESEFEKYRIIQDQIYVSDFDKYINELEKLDVSDKGE